MAQVRSGKVIRIGDSFKTIKPLTEKGVDQNSECKVVDFNEMGYPILTTKDGRVTFVVSAFVTGQYLDVI